MHIRHHIVNLGIVVGLSAFNPATTVAQTDDTAKIGDPCFSDRLLDRLPEKLSKIADPIGRYERVVEGGVYRKKRLELGGQALMNGKGQPSYDILTAIAMGEEATREEIATAIWRRAATYAETLCRANDDALDELVCVNEPVFPTRTVAPKFNQGMLFITGFKCSYQTLQTLSESEEFAVQKTANGDYYGSYPWDQITAQPTPLAAPPASAQ
jgi:hypothetical protein